MDGIATIEQSGLRERVLAELENAILLGKLPEGTRLVEAEIATRMGVSKTPVREALLLLEQSGLVRLFPRRGAVVAGVDLTLIDEVFALRELIECYAVEQALVRMTAADLAELDRRLDRLDRAVRTDPDNHRLISDCDLTLHEYLFERSSNRLLLDLWQVLRRRMHLVHVVTSLGTPAHPGASAFETKSEAITGRHRAYVDVLRKGDVRRAVEATREHLRVGWELARKSYAELGAGRAAARDGTH